MKKKLLLVLIIIIFINNISAEIGVRIYNYRPTGDFGAVFKPAFSVEAGYITRFKKYVRPVVFVTLLNMKPRMSEFPVTGEIEDYNGLIVYPGTQSYKSFVMLQIHGGIDVAVLKKEKFSIFLGTNLIAGGAFVHYHTVIPGVNEDEGYVIGLEGGLQFRVGTEYQLTKHIGLFVSANRNYFRMFSEDVGGNYWSNDYGLGVIYKFNEDYNGP